MGAPVVPSDVAKFSAAFVGAAQVAALAALVWGAGAGASSARGAEAAPADTPRVMVFAAASTTAALSEIAARFAARGKGRAVMSFASSSTLAKQIANGAPADIYLSANPGWMDYLARENAIEPATRLDLLGNRLVLVAPAGSALRVRIAPAFPLAEKLGEGRLAIGDPDHVPAGIYGRAALRRLGAWPALAGRVARTQDVRGALVLVERGEAAAAVVYATDAALTDRVRVVATFPADSHPPIRYPIAIVAGRDRPEVRRFYEFLTSPEAARVFTRHGFTVIAPAARQ
ncbi:MAG: molybdate ABC transporter substrate-binding protein [Proteobacteria bacterium]|nr:molybdate ABC transporter substrate-binding protein [Pseudomonadota bacterium]